MRVTHTVASITDPGAGPSYSVPALAAGLAALGDTVTVRTVAGWRDGEMPPGAEVSKPVTVAHHTQDMARLPLARGLCLSRDMRDALARGASETDVFHTHGLWLMPNVYPARAAQASGKPFVVSPRGMLGREALGFSNLKKCLFWIALQRRALMRAACVHATSDDELADIRSAGLANPVAVIPNGVNIPVALPASDRGKTRTLLSLGRLHPKKGLELLLEAWARLEPDYPEWHLRIVGPDEVGYATKLTARADRLGLTRTSIEGPLAGADKWRALAEAELFALPSLHENFALTVAEALASGTPVISSKGAPWAGIEEHGCGWWVDRTPEAFTETLRQAISLSDAARGDMGAKGRAWMARDFSWAKVATQMHAVYEWLARGSVRPECVHLD